MKKLLLLASCLLASNAFAKELTDYGMVKNAVTHGKQLRIVFDLSKCKQDNQPGPKFAGFSSITPSEVNITHNDEILASTSTWVKDPGGKALAIDNKFIMIRDDFNVHVWEKFIYAKNPDVNLEEYSMVCPITSGAHIYSV